MGGGGSELNYWMEGCEFKSQKYRTVTTGSLSEALKIDLIRWMVSWGKERTKVPAKWINENVHVLISIRDKYTDILTQFWNMSSEYVILTKST